MRVLLLSASIDDRLLEDRLRASDPDLELRVSKDATELDAALESCPDLIVVDTATPTPTLPAVAALARHHGCTAPVVSLAAVTAGPLPFDQASSGLAKLAVRGVSKRSRRAAGRAIPARATASPGARAWAERGGEKRGGSGRGKGKGERGPAKPAKRHAIAASAGEEWFRTLAEQLPVIVWTADAHGRIDYHNRRWEDYAGGGGSEWFEAVHPDDVRATQEAAERSVTTGAPYEVTHRLRRKDGAYRWFLCRAEAMRGEHGRIVRWLGTTTDIHDRKQAEEELERRVGERTAALAEANARLAYQASLLDNVDDAVVATDARFVVNAWNPAAERLYGWPRDLALGRPVRHLVPTQFAVPWPEVERRLREQGSFRGEVEQISRDGTRLQIEATAMSLRGSDGAISGFVAVARDVTRRRQAEEALRRARERVEILHEIDRAALAAATPESIAERALGRICALLAADHGAVLLEDQEDTARVVAVHCPAPPIFAAGNRVPVAALKMTEGFARGELLRVDELDVIDPPCLATRSLLGAGLHSDLAVPLIVDTHLIGSLELARRSTGSFADEEIEVIQEVAASLAVALRAGLLIEQLKASRARLHAASRNLVELLERERRTIARELHDEAGQSLTALLVGLGLLERESFGRNATLARVTELKSLVDSVMEGLHRLSANLRPSALDRMGLEGAVRQIVEQLRAQGMDAEYTARGLREGDLPLEVETTIFRAVQEALTNVMRHAQASRAEVALARRAQSVSAVVHDDGVGFDPSTTGRDRLGLTGMQERVELLGGRLTIESRPGAGTRVEVEVPVTG